VPALQEKDSNGAPEHCKKNRGDEVEVQYTPPYYDHWVHPNS